jgi:hypothetical protein
MASAFDRSERKEKDCKREQGRRDAPKSLVRLRRQIEVEPAELLVVRTDDKVVSHRVNVD